MSEFGPPWEVKTVLTRTYDRELPLLNLQWVLAHRADGIERPTFLRRYSQRFNPRGDHSCL